MVFRNSRQPVPFRYPPSTPSKVAAQVATLHTLLSLLKHTPSGGAGDPSGNLSKLPCKFQSSSSESSVRRAAALSTSANTDMDAPEPMHIADFEGVFILVACILVLSLILDVISKYL